LERIEIFENENNFDLIAKILSKIYPLILSENLFNFNLKGEGEGEGILIENYLKKFCSSVKMINLEYLRLLQVIILCKSVRVSEEDDYEDLNNFNWGDSEMLGITLISKDLTKKEIFIKLKEEGQELFHQFLMIHRELKPAMLTGWINLLHPIVKTRPSFYPSLIPTLLSFTESKWSESFNPVQKRNVLHTLKAELSSLMSVPRAEKFYPLILDSLDKCAVLNQGTNGGVKKRNTSTLEAPSIDEAEAEEERELAASLGGIQDRMSQRPSGAFADTSVVDETMATTTAKITSDYESLASEASSRDLIKIPAPMVIEMIVRMLGSWTLDQIRPVVMTRWKRTRGEETAPNVPIAPEIVLKKTTEEAFTLEAGPLVPELPGEMIHLSVSRILQSITDLSEYHALSRRDDLISNLDEGDSVMVPTSSNSGIARGIPIPLIPLCRIVSLVAAHVGHVRSDILMDPEDRRKKLDRQFDPRFRATKKTDDIFGGSSDEEEDVKMEEEEFDKTVNQIVLGWINEDLPGRFDFVWYWLEAVWVREGKSGNLMTEIGEESKAADYDKLFDDIIGVVGEYFIADSDADAEAVEGDNKEIVPGALERVLKILLKVPKLNASFVRNLLYPLIEESRYRPIALQALAQLLIQRPALRAMLTDFVMTLAESEEADLRKDTIEILLLRQGLYPNLRSLSSQLEAYSLDLMDDLASKDSKEVLSGSGPGTGNENEMKRLKIESVENLLEERLAEGGEGEGDVEGGFQDLGEFEANTELFLGLLKRNPERLLPPLLVRFPRFSVKLQAFLLDRSLPQVVNSWTLKELRGLLNVLRSESKVNEGGIVGELVIQIVKLVLSSGAVSTDADMVDFYDELSELVQGKVTSGIWDGRVIPDLLPWILGDRSDLPDFYNIYLPKLISTSPTEFMTSCTKICSTGSGQLVSPTQLFLQVHLMTSVSGSTSTSASASTSTTVSVPLKNLIEVLQLIFIQAKNSAAVTSTSATGKNEQNLFTVHVISSGLGQLVDQTPLPPLLGRSLLQSIPLLSPSCPLNGPFILSLLSRLIPRKIWEAGKLWEGWIRCCRALLPGSLSVLLQLPTGQLEKLLQEGGGDLKGPLKEYLYNQPPSVRNRYTSILAAIEK
jgi:hypothetical protein